MNLSLYIAKRYLFSKKGHQVINIISGVAIAGIALATAAMVCTLSVFNGFQSVVAKQFSAFEADLKITAASGKAITTDAPEIVRVAELPQVSGHTFSIEGKVMASIGGRQTVVTIKGVDDAFAPLLGIDKVLYGSGEFVLNDGVNDYAVPGGGLIQELNCGILFTTPLEIYAPNRLGAANLTNPARNFKKSELHSTGLVFVLNQPKYDYEYVITSDSFARSLFSRGTNEATSMELNIKSSANADKTKKEIEKILGNNYTVQDRYEQQESVYKVMQVEKIISYIFLTFILMVACFNIIGSLAMLIIEKRENMITLHSLGAERKTIANIFVFEGAIISTIGAVIGIIAGVALSFVQQHFGLISMGASDGFIVDSYPVEIIPGDIAATFVTVVVVGFTTVWLPIKALTRRYV